VPFDAATTRGDLRRTCPPGFANHKVFRLHKTIPHNCCADVEARIQPSEAKQKMMVRPERPQYEELYTSKTDALHIAFS